MDVLKTVADGVMEATVVPSFTRLGLCARAKMFDWDQMDIDLSGRVMIVTGSTSGIGLAAAQRLTGLGAHAVLIGRNEQRGLAAVDEIQSAGGSAAFVALDMGDLEAVAEFAVRFTAEHDRLDALIHNAGALLPERRETDAGVELTLAVHLLGPYELTRGLRPLLAATGGSRVVWMSSGGMYATGLDLNRLEAVDEGYDGRAAYARVKRAQVSLARVMARDFEADGIAVHAMHPGWVATPGVDAGIPLFGKIMGPLLRTADQGADTMVWLAAGCEPEGTSGGFWHDRKRRSTTKIPGTAPDPAVERELVPWIEARIAAAAV